MTCIYDWMDFTEWFTSTGPAIWVSHQACDVTYQEPGYSLMKYYSLWETLIRRDIIILMEFSANISPLKSHKIMCMLDDSHALCNLWYRKVIMVKLITNAYKWNWWHLFLDNLCTCILLKLQQEVLAQD